MHEIYLLLSIYDCKFCSKAHNLPRLSDISLNMEQVALAVSSTTHS